MSPPSDWIPIPFTQPSNPYASAFLAPHSTDTLQTRRDVGLELLSRVTQPEVQSGRQTCLPGTRTEMVRNLYDWATNAAPSRISCVYGPMGVGKSTILRTVESLLYDTGKLGASFVFRRDGHRNETLVCTLAHQLTRNVPSVRPIISRVVRKYPAVLEEDMATQFRKLILEPCRKAAVPSLILIIDGLDDCEAGLLRETLSLLEDAVQKDNSPLRAILASRLSLDIFQSVSVASLSVARSFDDVRAYLSFECSKIRHGASPWMTAKALPIAVRVSCGCFLTARTLIKFLGDPEFCPTQRINQLSRVAAAPPQAFPHNPLDSLFFMILSSSSTSDRGSLMMFLRIITTPQLSRLSMSHIEQLLGLKPGRLRTRLLPQLQALLAQLPDTDAGRVEVFHPSFVDFLLDPARSEDFCVATASCDVALVGCVLRALAYNRDPRANAQGHVGWSHLDVMVDYITSVDIDPSSNPEIIASVESINPDFFFHTLLDFGVIGIKMIEWLKRMPVHPVSAKATALWEEYEYMSFFHGAVSDFDVDDFDAEGAHEHQSDLTKNESSLLHHPVLQRLIRASLAVPALTPLAHFRLLLGASYDDLRAVVYDVLRPLFGRDISSVERLWAAHARTMGSTSAETTDKACGWGDVFRDLALNSIRITKGVYSGQLSSEMMG
ncbi:hypothetical protein C8F01DRAFT_347170 [Mycena amicta]|nr:hypothetical protein C8F01DRAFT_347170 [Mycena amicta]